jgi:translation initiation factor 2 beta subunit (eIF-2beta)/eIF-5
VEEGTSIEEIIIKEFGSQGVTTEEVIVLLENDNRPREHSHQVKDHFRHHDHIHCHRCKNVEITFSYNNLVKTISVPPSKTGGELVKAIPELYNMTLQDAQGLRLEISPDVHVAINDHIGRFVSYPECRLHITLTSKHKVQG